MAKILVIDDDLTVQMVLLHLLQREGHKVSTAQDGSEGIQIAKKQHPDVIICDWMMPGVDGLEVCRYVHRDPDLATTFFILLTAREDLGDRIKGLDAGADEFLSKPIEAEELLARMRAGLRSRRLTQEVAQTNQYLAALVEVQNLLLASDGQCIVSHPDNLSASEDQCLLYNQAIATLGKAVDASQVYVCQLSSDQNGDPKILLQGEWPKELMSNNTQPIPAISPLKESLFPRWLEILETGQIISGSVSEFPEAEQQSLAALGLSAIVILPLIVDIKLFGWLGFVFKQQNRFLNPSHIEILRAAAAAFSLHFDRVLAEDELRNSEAHYRAIVEDQTELICRFNPDGKLTFVNEAYCRYFGISRSMALTDSLVCFIPDIDRDFIQKPVVIHENKVVLKNGNVRWLQWSDRAIIDEFNNLLGFQAVAQDITERKRAEVETLKALEKEKELSELRSRFVSMVSHEFRNPLTSIISAADLLEYYIESGTTEKKLQYIERIQSAATTMNELLEDVLVIGRYEANKIRLNCVVIDLNNFCKKLVQELEFSFNQKKIISFTVQELPGVWPTEQSFSEDNRDRLKRYQGFMDEKLLRQILVNLLSNAVKYSPEGSPVNFELSFTEAEAIFIIQDSGIGIPPDDLPHLFESFHRCENVGMIPGTGLGLTIVKRSVEMQGGEIFVESKVGVGTTFTVKLPLKAKESETTSSAS
jgi:PAS domain S-box-containing protein